MRIFCGYDSRAPDAFRVCEASMRRHASAPLEIRPLDLAQLRAEGIYTREHELREGVLWDVISDEPCSTEFSISRFLVPHLAGYRGWALYCDCDFLWRADVAELFALAREEYAAMVVKHNYIALAGGKMDGQINRPYPRKNWSSLILWNCGHPANTRLTPWVVNHWRRRELHVFQWMHDWEIGGLPTEYNWLDLEPRAVHFSLGTPDLAGYEHAAYADEYRSYL